ncbi:hypothetical protein BRADI_3g44605v3 [Brachypodium distachyon]|uniref:Uncharacterized protein n=1 Tax=Brachypodium distachyon TaxID=15368 RepID=A0A2K2D388_BRADI|nr:hypothetical protein BRADI_3g44605v3 [Brachypodium distachyon]
MASSSSTLRAVLRPRDAISPAAGQRFRGPHLLLPRTGASSRSTPCRSSTRPKKCRHLRSLRLGGAPIRRPRAQAARASKGSPLEGSGRSFRGRRASPLCVLAWNEYPGICFAPL